MSPRGQSARKGLTTPAWLVGPGLIIPPLFLAMFAAVWPRPVAPTVAVPRLDAQSADREVRSLLAMAENAELAESERLLLTLWLAHGQARLLYARSERQAVAAVAARRNLAKQCRTVQDEHGVDRALVVGDVAASRLVSAVLRAGEGGREARGRLEAAGGTFHLYARRVGLLDPAGRLSAHPLVAAVAVMAGFRAECGLPADQGLSPFRGAALDLLYLRFGRGLPPAARAAAAARLAEHDPSYPGAQAQAAILLAAGDTAAAAEVLRRALRRAPTNRALRNHLLFVEGVAGRS